jgi:hypothetical protein
MSSRAQARSGRPWSGSPARGWPPGYPLRDCWQEGIRRLAHSRVALGRSTNAVLFQMPRFCPTGSRAVVSNRSGIPLSCRRILACPCPRARTPYPRVLTNAEKGASPFSQTSSSPSARRILYISGAGGSGRDDTRSFSTLQTSSNEPETVEPGLRGPRLQYAHGRRTAEQQLGGYATHSPSICPCLFGTRAWMRTSRLIAARRRLPYGARYM